MNKLPVCRVNICDSNYGEGLADVERMLAGKSRNFAVFLEANLLYSLRTIPGLAAVLNRAGFIFPDGVATVKAARLRHRRRIERMPGPTFILKACEYGQKREWRHFFYGGAPGVAEKLADELKKAYPEMIVCGVFSPPFRPLAGERLEIPESEDRAEIKMINDARPDIVWVGLGGPKQEYWMASHLGKIEAPLMMGVGAAFDFHSGARPWAPRWIRAIGMEWLYRMFSGGRKTFSRNLRCVSNSLLLLTGYFIKYRIFNKNKETE